MNTLAPHVLPDGAEPAPNEGAPSIPYTEAARQAFLRDTRQLIETLSARVQRNRNALDEYLLLGRLFRIRGEPKRALRIHQNLLVRPSLEKRILVSLYTELGYDVLESRNKDYGQSYFEKALSLDKSDVSALEGLAQSHEFQGQLEDAVKALSRLVKLGRPEESHMALVGAELALSHLERRQVAKARRAVDQAMKSDGNCLYAHLALADVYLEAGKHDKAISTLKEVLRRWPTHSFLALRRLEDAHYRMDAFPAYENTLRDCLRSMPDNYYLHYSLARHLRKKRRNDEAMEYLRRSFELNPMYVNTVRDRIDLLAQGENASKIRSIASQFFALLKRCRRFICPNCRHRYVPITWHCQKCGTWGVFDIRYELPAP